MKAMTLRIAVQVFLLIVTPISTEWMEMPAPEKRPGNCLTGDVTPVQSWFHANGTIIQKSGTDNVIDLSYRDDPAPTLQRVIATARTKRVIRFLSLAGCHLTSVPIVFHIRSRNIKSLASTLEYISLYGNIFNDHGPAGERYEIFMNASSAKETDVNKDMVDVTTLWDKGFQGMTFPRLLQLDLRSCSIHYLHSDLLANMPNLSALYLSGNNIYEISGTAFRQLPNLLHLDLSRNEYLDKSGTSLPITWGSDQVLRGLNKLRSLDLSFTSITQIGIQVITNLGPELKRLSICYTGIKTLRDYMFYNTSLQYLDVSGNYGLLNENCALKGLENSLRVLYADSIGLRSMLPFDNFTQLKVLKLSNNEISNVLPSVAISMTNLEILDLDFNRVSSWFSLTFSLFKKLNFLSLRHNNINVIKSVILQDLENITYIGLGDNFFVCSCHARELFEIAQRNEMKDKHIRPYAVSQYNQERDFILRSPFPTGLFDYIDRKYNQERDFILRSTFHTGFVDYNREIDNRSVVKRTPWKQCKSHVPLDGNFLLFDYSPDRYQCLMAEDGEVRPFANVSCCSLTKSGDIYEDYINNGWKKIVLIAAAGIAVVGGSLATFIFRRKFKYFLITVKNSALLSSIDQPAGYEDGSIFNYDVFVSYCNEDRTWVLDQLLPHLETECSISVCLHERDFQVGLSILENIVSCIDRSRSILLVISPKFLLSQWCQFEMHLAQHRIRQRHLVSKLLETRREDLILVLLEDIPRRIRPNTLHYLMITKTYLVWGKSGEDHDIFWRRLKKSLTTQKLKTTENVSLA